MKSPQKPAGAPEDLLSLALYSIVDSGRALIRDLPSVAYAGVDAECMLT